MNNYARVIRAELSEGSNNRSDHYTSKPSSAWDEASDAQNEEEDNMDCRFFLSDEEENMDCCFFTRGL